jgi:hypothetical protein
MRPDSQTKQGVIPGYREAADPESVFQRPVFMGSGFDPAGRPGMTTSAYPCAFSV